MQATKVPPGTLASGLKGQRSTVSGVRRQHWPLSFIGSRMGKMSNHRPLTYGSGMVGWPLVPGHAHTLADERNWHHRTDAEVWLRKTIPCLSLHNSSRSGWDLNVVSFVPRTHTFNHSVVLIAREQASDPEVKKDMYDSVKVRRFQFPQTWYTVDNNSPMWTCPNPFVYEFLTSQFNNSSNCINRWVAIVFWQMSRSGFLIGSNMLSLSVLHGSLDERGVWGRIDTCLQMAEFLCGPPEMITTLLISYTPTQNKKFKKYAAFEAF